MTAMTFGDKIPKSATFDTTYSVVFSRCYSPSWESNILFVRMNVYSLIEIMVFDIV